MYEVMLVRYTVDTVPRRNTTHFHHSCDCMRYYQDRVSREKVNPVMINWPFTDNWTSNAHFYILIEFAFKLHLFFDGFLLSFFFCAGCSGQLCLYDDGFCGWEASGNLTWDINYVDNTQGDTTEYGQNLQGKIQVQNVTQLSKCQQNS